MTISIIFMFTIIITLISIIPSFYQFTLLPSCLLLQHLIININHYTQHSPLLNTYFPFSTPFPTIYFSILILKRYSTICFSKSFRYLFLTQISHPSPTTTIPTPTELQTCIHNLPYYNVSCINTNTQ